MGSNGLLARPLSSGSEVEVSVSLPATVYQAIKRNIIGSSYKSVEDYLRSIIMETVVDSGAYSAEDESEIRKRLASLGYE